MQAVDQGTLIYGMRSEKYPEQACYGIVISARCDIANCKIRRLYYLIAVGVEEWLVSEAGFEVAIKTVLNGARDSFFDGAKSNGLDGETLLSFDTEQVRTVIYSELKEKAAEALMGRYQQYRSCLCSTLEARRSKIKTTDSKKIKKVLEDINNGVYTHLYYLPEAAFRKDGQKSKGLIVDLQEIEAISITDIEAICKNKVDGLVLNSESAEYYSRFCWIEGKECYTDIDGLIVSPWCEHLMQRFAHGFIRIGLDGATSEDFGKLIRDMQGGNK